MHLIQISLVFSWEATSAQFSTLVIQLVIKQQMLIIQISLVCSWLWSNAQYSNLLVRMLVLMQLVHLIQISLVRSWYYATNASYSNFMGQSWEGSKCYQSNFFGQNAGNGAINANVSNFIGSSAVYGATNASASNFWFTAGYRNKC
jgi:hypothetical protein